MKKMIHTKKLSYSKEWFFPLYKKIAKDYDIHILLESGRSGRYSMAGFCPVVEFTGKDNKLYIKTSEGVQVAHGNPLHEMKKWLKQYEIEEPLGSLPDFHGGVLGFVSYDYGRYIENLPDMTEDDLEMPDTHFFLFEEWFVFDHDTEELWLIFAHDKEEDVTSRETAWVNRWTEEVEQGEVQLAGEKEPTLKDVSISEETFVQAVEKVQSYIASGDVFQVNLSVRGSQKLNVPPIEVYSHLRELNPSPYMGYLNTPDYQLVSGSPELLVKKKGDEVSTRPIAGTRSRGKDEREDLKLANELIENEKERAEHVMLVDLERNDLGRVCQYGTVEVNEFMVIEKYSHVMHIVSNVRGQIANGRDGYDLIDASFPGGTITGAPKIRTMEIIDELEPVRRGIYTGSLGWIGFNGDLELNIMIRTMLVKEEVAYVQAGAGIVIDSEAHLEYKESLKKAKALWRAKELAEEKGDWKK
ncbi:anthranilate synthase component I family protein [Cytobacillus kochii]|uniref:anthranilate synthase component I family protein n=1 Tax=Cytobacillus TaxID=2675230 RepID=UPI00278B770A|nr:anthranilate synthase component I family protein [Cytobacillus kochii]MDQ0188125.1 para-aminobenzoate synthetase component 1 [Cytobacillus kochii]